MTLGPVHRSIIQDAGIHASLLGEDWWPLRSGVAMGHYGATIEQSWYFDQKALQLLGIQPTTSLFCFGQFRSGKSGWLKKYAMGKGLHATPIPDGNGGIIWIRNRVYFEYFKQNMGEPEYDPIVVAMGGRKLNLMEASFDPCSPELGLDHDRKMRVISNLYLRLKYGPTGGHVTSTLERNALTNGITIMEDSPDPKVHSMRGLTDIIDGLAKGNPRYSTGKEVIGANKEKYRDACAEIAMTFDAFLKGENGRLISGGQSRISQLFDPCIGFDYTNIDQEIRDFALSTLYEVRTAALQSKNPKFRQMAATIIVSDECGRTLAVDAIAESTFETLKLIRGFGLEMLFSTQRPSDILMLENKYAQRIIDEVGAIVIGQGLSVKEVKLMQEKWKFSNLLRDSILSLSNLPGKGWFIYYSPLRELAVLHRTALSEEEQRLTNTEQANQAAMSGSVYEGVV